MYRSFTGRCFRRRVATPACSRNFRHTNNKKLKKKPPLHERTYCSASDGINVNYAEVTRVRVCDTTCAQGSVFFFFFTNSRVSRYIANFDNATIIERYADADQTISRAIDDLHFLLYPLVTNGKKITKDNIIFTFRRYTRGNIIRYARTNTHTLFIQEYPVGIIGLGARGNHNELCLHCLDMNLTSARAHCEKKRRVDVYSRNIQLDILRCIVRRAAASATARRRRTNDLMREGLETRR